MSCASLIPRFWPGNEASHVHEITSPGHPSIVSSPGHSQSGSGLGMRLSRAQLMSLVRTG